jgi:hypothetical protein
MDVMAETAYPPRADIVFISAWTPDKPVLSDPVMVNMGLFSVIFVCKGNKYFRDRGKDVPLLTKKTSKCITNTLHPISNY